MIHSNHWPKGYQEVFNTLEIKPLTDALKELSGETCLEIGCGNGFWTKKLLVPKFKTVIAVDIIDKWFNEFAYFKQDNLNFKNVSKVDAAYSFGVFCHLTIKEQSDYLKQLRPLLKGKGLITFANWPRHESLKTRPMDKVVDGWYYNDLEITGKMLKNVGFEWYDFDPSYRDTIAIIC